MNKIWLVIQREYLTRVKKKSFLITTIIVPLVIIGFYAAIIAVQVSDSSESAKIAVIDDADLFGGKLESDDKGIAYDFVKGETEQSYKTKYKKAGYNYFLYIPKLDISEPKGVNIHSETSVGIATKSKIEKKVNDALETKRIEAAKIDMAQYKSINSDIKIANPLDSGRESSTAAATIVATVCGVLIYMILMIYGTMVMRGVMEEKINRIAEVIVSSVKPFQLMLGKIIGIGLVGITQFAIWFVLLFVLSSVLPLLFPGFMEQAQSVASGQAGNTAGMLGSVGGALSSLPIGLIIFCFIVYFIGGYLMYASMFAAIGSVISEDQQEAQQLVFPVMMPIILGFVIMTKAITDPNSALAIFGSMFPLTSPIVMMARVCFDVPMWQLALSIAFLILGFLFFTWLTAKIYRTGILLYGKKVTWKEMIKWVFRRS